VVRAYAEAGVPFVARDSGTGLSGGALPPQARSRRIRAQSRSPRPDISVPLERDGDTLFVAPRPARGLDDVEQVESGELM
jgi:FAD/FMN-containing dehydrogenase